MTEFYFVKYLILVPGVPHSGHFVKRNAQHILLQKNIISSCFAGVMKRAAYNHADLYITSNKLMVIQSII